LQRRVGDNHTCPRGCNPGAICYVQGIHAAARTRCLLRNTRRSGRPLRALATDATRNQGLCTKTTGGVRSGPHAQDRRRTSVVGMAARHAAGRSQPATAATADAATGNGTLPAHGVQTHQPANEVRSANSGRQTNEDWQPPLAATRMKPRLAVGSAH